MDSPAAFSLFTLKDDALLRAIEALLFAAEAPLEAARIAGILVRHTGDQTFTPERIDALIQQLNERLEAQGSALRAAYWSGGYRLATTPENADLLKIMFETRNLQKLSRSVMETLSVIAYRQPCTKPEVDYIRGVNSDYAIKKLLEIGFIAVLGRSEAVGQPLLYGTTPAFLEQFGLNALQDLPRLREIEELLSDPAYEREKQELMLLEKVEETEKRTAHEA